MRESWTGKMQKKMVALDTGGIEEALNFISESLKKSHKSEKTVYEAMLLTEESMVRLMECTEKKEQLQISIHKHIGISTIQLSVPGDRIAFDGKSSVGNELNTDEMGPDTEAAIRDIVLRSYANKIKYKNKNGFNCINIIVGMVEQQLATITLLSLILSIAIGMILRGVLPEQAILFLDSYLLVPVEKMFISMLQLVTAPAVFFSIVCCVAQFAEFSDPGRVSAKIFVSYFVGTVAAVLIGVVGFRIFKPGSAGLFENLVNQAATSGKNAGAVPVLDTIVSGVPANIVEPFLTSNALQLVVLALLCGIAVGMVGDYAQTIQKFFSVGNLFFSKIISLIMNIVPIAVFCSTISILIHVGGVALWSVVELMVAVLLGFGCMLLLYCVLILVVGRMNPIVFLKKYWPDMKNTFILGSGIAAIPNSIRACKVKLGISPKVYSFSIPFGAVANMDGNCIYLAITGLFLAHMCGIEIFGSDMISVIFAIMVLSVGAPIAPGSALLCLFVLLTQMGVSLEATSLIIGVNFFIEMLLAMTNTVGDVAISLVVAKSEKLVDLDVYYDRR